jgi:ribosomal protein S21
MIIVELNGKMSIDSALKTLKNKFIKTKTPKELNERKTFTKKSEKRRAVIKKAMYTQKKRDSFED